MEHNENLPEEEQAVVVGKRYGSKFSSGFLHFYESRELSDVLVITPCKTEYKLHMLLLAYHSEFFRRAFTSGFKESAERKIELHFDDPANVWLLLVDYFYTEEIDITPDNVLPLLALSRALIVPKVQEFCEDFADHNLDESNAMNYLSEAARYNCESIRQSCVKLMAQDFPNSFFKPVGHLTVEDVLDVLSHSMLAVQTEEQVLDFVLGYIKVHSLDSQSISRLLSCVRLPYLSNDCLAMLAKEDSMPKDVLFHAMSTRLHLLDHPDRMASCLVQPRPTYICALEYGLPGGSEFVSLPLELVWDDLIPQLRVQVSGDIVEGDPECILRADDDSSWFTVSSHGGADSTPLWVEIEFPAHMRVCHLAKFTFSHGLSFANSMVPYGISDSAYFQTKGITSRVAMEGDNFVRLRTQDTCAMHTEYTVTIDTATSPTVRCWRKLRLSTPSQAEGGCRLSIRRLRLYGMLELSLLGEPPDGAQQMLTAFRRRQERPDGNAGLRGMMDGMHALNNWPDDFFAPL